MNRTIFPISMVVVVSCFFNGPVSSQDSGGIPGFGGGSGGNPIQNLVPPKGSNFNFALDAQRNPHYTYEGPENFKDPIRIWFKEEDKYNPNRKPDLYVWADEIHWHAGIQSGTAAGRIIVDNSTEYRIETTYVEYDHKTKQIYCPRQVKIVQRLEGPDNVIVAESALVTLDEKGIKSARFDGFLETDVRPVDNAPNPFKREDKPKPIAPPPAPKLDAIPVLPESGRRKIAPPVYAPSTSSNNRSANARSGP